jgi:hypothetical protein
LKVSRRFAASVFTVEQQAKQRNQREAVSKQNLFFDPEDGGDMFLPKQRLTF